MLPDFAGMVGARLSSQAQDASPLGRGISLHHRTDELFHGADEFLDLMQDAMGRLTALGVARGPARAIGHIGVEMLIDGELLAREPALADTYERTLAHSGGVDPAVFREQSGHEGYRVLHHRLSAHGAPYDYRNVDAVTRRLVRMLAHRPRLSLAETDAEHVIRSAGAGAGAHSRRRFLPCSRDSRREPPRRPDASARSGQAQESPRRERSPPWKGYSRAIKG